METQESQTVISKALQLRRLQTRLAKCESVFFTLTDQYSQVHVIETIAGLLQEIEALKASGKQQNYVV